MAKIVSIRKGFEPSEKQRQRAETVQLIGSILRRGSVFDPLPRTKIQSGGDVTFPGFAFKVNVYFQTEVEAIEFQRLASLVCRRPLRNPKNIAAVGDRDTNPASTA